MAGFRRSFRWPSDSKKTFMIAIPRSEAGFGFTVAWTKPPLVDYIHEGGNAEKAGLMPGDKIICIDKIKVSKKNKEEIENIVKNVKDILELEITRPESELATRKRQTSLRRKESFTKKGSKMIIQDCNIMLWRRERAVLKLLLCEEDLLSTIAKGKERFILMLRRKCNLATPMELNILFGNMEEVASVHERFVQQLRQMTQGNDDSIGRLYQKQVDKRCASLKTYVYGLHLAKILLRYKMSNKFFREFIEKQEKLEDSFQIVKLIEKPVQYISDLTLQMETLLSCTAVGHRDYICLESIVSVYQNFGREMNDVMIKLSSFVDFESVESIYNDEEPYINLETLQEKSIFTKGPKNFSLIHPGRYWLFSGELSKIEGRHYIQYWGLLLSDCLILSRRTEQRVLLILDEPVMLRSIYQASFDVKKCDTEFRILFALENPKKTAGQRTQWVTWILRAPSVGIKLLWQTILTYQLSFYSTEALNAGTKSSFVHARPIPGVKELALKKSSKYEESSFVTLTEGCQVPLSCPGTSKHIEALTSKEFSNIQPRVNKFVLPMAKRADLMKEISTRKSKERSYASLNENVISPCVGDITDQLKFPRSKSFGNDFGDAIPFIDSSEENESELDTTCVESVLSPTENATTTDNLDANICERNDEDEYPSTSQSAPNTPHKSDKFVQTDDSTEFSEQKDRRSPKKRFPRLGTFERIKIDKRNSSLPNTPSQEPIEHTRTGTSFKHRRHIKTTASKELLLKSSTISPSCEDKGDAECVSQPPINEKKKSRSIFSRFWKRDNKGPQKDTPVTTNGEETQKESNVDEDSTIECPPDYESAVRSTESTWPEQTLMSTD